MKKNKEDKRISRPNGITYQCLLYHKEKEERIKEQLLTKIQTNIIEIYVNEGMIWNGKVMNVNKMAAYLNMPIEILMMRMNRTLARVGNILNGKDGMAIARGLILNCLKNGLEGHALALNQVHLLAAKQGNKYVPFLTTEVNKSIANLTTAQKPMADLLKMMMDKMPSSHTPIGTGDSGNGPYTNTKYLTPDEAVTLIRNEKPTILEDGALLDHTMTLLPGLPEVRANYQDLTAIGIKNMKPELIPIEENKAAERQRNHRRESLEVLDESTFHGPK